MVSEEILMLIAFPKLNDNISPVLDTAKMLIVIEINNGEVKSQSEISLCVEKSRDKAKLIANHTNILVCGAVSREMYSHLRYLGVKVYPWYMGKANEIIGFLSNGVIPGPQYDMPGCRRNRQGSCGRRNELTGSGPSKKTIRQRTTAKKGFKQ